jgi:hypothetical protein
MISVELAQVLWYYLSLRSLRTFFFPINFLAQNFKVWCIVINY